MSALTINLKQLYGQRGLVWLYAVGAVFVFLLGAGVLFDGRTQEGEFAVLLLPVFGIGIIVAVLQMEMLSKACSFCLPGHRVVVRRLVLIVGLVVSFAFALPFIGYPGLFDVSLTPGVVVLCSAFCANLIAYMAGLVLGFTVRGAVTLVCLLPAITMLAGEFGLGVTVERAILYSPPTVIVPAGIVAALGWLWLGRPAWFRRCCGQYWTELFGLWNRSHMEKARQVHASRRFTRQTSPAIDRFFQDAIGNRGVSDLRKYIWAGLYPTYVLFALQWRGLLFVTLLAALWGAYMPPVASAIAGVIPLMLAGILQPPLHSASLVVGGRRERFFATIAVMLVVGVASVLVVGAAVVLTHILAPVAPTIEWRRVTLRLEPIRLAVLLLPLVVLPLVGLARVLFYRNPAQLILFTMLLSMAVVISAWRAKSVAPLWLAAAAVVLRAVCLVTTHAIAMRRDLVWK